SSKRNYSIFPNNYTLICLFCSVFVLYKMKKRFFGLFNPQAEYTSLSGGGGEPPRASALWGLTIAF
ncbi:hypothetical protein, partial [Desemzia sp. FAM 23991]|uniref:hypothetical protein n=1 Tax=Desemzia sp. FAM 23991 TaxID=3259521 RepID=UPI0038881923